MSGRPTFDKAKEKILRYCAYQERCHSEVRDKLFELGMDEDDAGELITFLISEGFLNEERFARTFARGKFRLKKWGRIRIKHELESRNVSKNCIRYGLSEIEDEEYAQTLEQILLSKAESLQEENVFVLRDKVSKYAIYKGFEPDIVWTKLRALFPDQR